MKYGFLSTLFKRGELQLLCSKTQRGFRADPLSLLTLVFVPYTLPLRTLLACTKYTVKLTFL